MWIHELIVLNKALTFNLAEIFKEGKAAESWIKSATESITSLKKFHLYISLCTKSKFNVLNCCFESPSLRQLYLSFSPLMLTGSVTKYFSNNILYSWVLSNLKHLMFISGNLFISVLFIFLSNMKALQNLMISCWYLINQFNKSLIYDENEQQLQICDETLKSCVI